MNLLNSSLVGISVVVLTIGSVFISKSLVSWLLSRDDKKTLILKNPENGKKHTIVFEPDMTKKKINKVLEELNHK